MIITIIIFTFTLLILVVIHELGHFLMAKKFGIKVLEFGFGIPPRAWGNKVGETLVSLNWLPFGGFVRLLGEDEPGPGGGEKSRYFMDRPVQQRIIVVVAGVVMNLLLAWLLFYIVLGFQGFKTQLPLLLDHQFIGVNQQNETVLIISKIDKDAGPDKIQNGDRIVAVNDEFVTEEKQLKELVKNNNSQKMKLTVSNLQKNNFRVVELTVPSELSVYIANVAKGSPAEKAGLKPGEKVIAINDQPVNEAEKLTSITKSLAGQPLKVTVADSKGNNQRQVEVVPRKNPPKNQGPLGVALRESFLPNLYINGFKLANLEYTNPIQKIFSGPVHSVDVVVYSGKILGSFISRAFEERDLAPVSQTVSGPVGITSVVNNILTENKNPLLPYLDFVAILSLNLAIMNVLPFPALDGGRLLFLVIEAVTRKKVHFEVERWVHTIGMAILLTLMLLVTFSDLRKIFS